MSKTIKKITVFTKFKGSGNSEYISSVQIYNQNGDLLSNKEFDAEENLDSVIEIDYNENNKIIHEKTMHIQDGFEESKSFEYNNNGDIKSQKIIYHGGAYSIKKYIKNSEDKSLEIITYDEDDEIEEKTILHFDEKNRLISQAEYDDREKMTEKTVNVFDDDKNVLLQKEEYNNKNKLEKVHFYFYNEDNNLIGIKTENRKGKLLDWVKLEYDDKGKVVMQKAMSGVTLMLEHDYDNNITVEKHFDASGNLFNEVKTEKDNLGNTVLEISTDKEVKYSYEFWEG